LIKEMAPKPKQPVGLPMTLVNMRGTSVRPRAPPKAVPDIPTWVSGLVESQVKGECVGAIAPSRARGAFAYVAR
jgi:hypothetical protein